MDSHDSLMDHKPVLSRRQIEGLIAAGRTIIIVDHTVLKVDAWLPYHPGGDKTIMHMVGRDATDEVNALHSADARLQMKKFEIGRIDSRWDNFIPPIQGGNFQTYIAPEVPALVVQHDDQTESSSLSSTAAPSPIFEPVDSQESCLRNRRGSDHTSISSASSLNLLAESPSKPRTTFLDSRTMDEIDQDTAKYPSLDVATQADIVQRYRDLNKRIHEAGLYQCRYSAYAIDSIRCAVFFALMFTSLRYGYYGTAGLFLGVFWHQLVFNAHDAGHMGITHNFQIDSCIGIFISDFLGGLSMGWWKRNHNVHHIVTNSPEHDPDIEHMPFFAISHRFFVSLRSTYYERIMDFDALAKVTIRYQDWLYYPLLTFGRFNLYRLSWEYLILGLGPKKGPAAWHRWLEIVGQVFFWTWFGYGILYLSIPTVWDRFVFIMVSHMVTAPLHVQITLSHFAMSTADLGVQESFPQKMLRTTMDVDCPSWLDWFHGGLQFQAIHHLFPRLPKHNLRKTQKLVQDFCDDVGIPYALYGFVDG